jgi:hypothetical protein
MPGYGGSPTVARHIFQPCPVWIYTQSNITNMNRNVHLASREQAHDMLLVSVLVSEVELKLSNC